jgi:hypothetical protein
MSFEGCIETTNNKVFLSPVGFNTADEHRLLNQRFIFIP